MLIDGGDLAWILEGRFDFTDALRTKLRAVRRPRVTVRDAATRFPV